MSGITDMPARTAERLNTIVRDVMRPGVITIGEGAELMHAKRAMARHRVHAVLVVGADYGRPLGWVTDRGLLRWLERDLSSIAARHAITEPPVYIDADATAREALEQLASSTTTHLLVGEAGRTPQGVIAPLDLVELVTRP
jgi:CBS domain-containing protein